VLTSIWFTRTTDTCVRNLPRNFELPAAKAREPGPTASARAAAEAAALLTKSRLLQSPLIALVLRMIVRLHACFYRVIHPAGIIPDPVAPAPERSRTRRSARWKDTLLQLSRAEIREHGGMGPLTACGESPDTCL
jgi:hypothetical protein